MGIVHTAGWIGVWLDNCLTDDHKNAQTDRQMHERWTGRQLDKQTVGQLVDSKLDGRTDRWTVS
jgi:hypothetical protein